MLRCHSGACASVKWDVELQTARQGHLPCCYLCDVVLIEAIFHLCSCFPPFSPSSQGGTSAKQADRMIKKLKMKQLVKDLGKGDVRPVLSVDAEWKVPPEGLQLA